MEKNNVMRSKEIRKKSISIVIELKLKLYTCITLLQDLNPGIYQLFGAFKKNPSSKISSFVISLSFPNWLELTPSLLPSKDYIVLVFTFQSLS